MRVAVVVILYALGCLLLGCDNKQLQQKPPSDALLAKSLVTIESSLGNITIELFNDTPKHRENFLHLVNRGYYNGLWFHRIIPGFIIQAGNKDTRDKPNPELDTLPPATLAPEIKHSHKRGTVAAARRDDDVNPKRESSGCEFFINLNDNRSYNGRYTVFGKVIEGMDVVDKFEKLPRDGMNVPYLHISLLLKSSTQF